MNALWRDLSCTSLGMRGSNPRPTSRKNFAAFLGPILSSWYPAGSKWAMSGRTSGPSRIRRRYSISCSRRRSSTDIVVALPPPPGTPLPDELPDLGESAPDGPPGRGVDPVPDGPEPEGPEPEGPEPDEPGPSGSLPPPPDLPAWYFFHRRRPPSTAAAPPRSSRRPMPLPSSLPPPSPPPSGRPPPDGASGDGLSVGASRLSLSSPFVSPPEATGVAEAAAASGFSSAGALAGASATPLPAL